MSILSQLKTQFPDYLWQPEAELAGHTYMKVGGPAEVLWVAQELDDLVSVLRYCQEHNLPYLILGGASNVVIRDEGVSGLVIINRCTKGEIYDSVAQAQTHIPLDPSYFTHVPESAKCLLAETGIPTALAVGLSTQQNLTGLEPFVGVPGTLGGAIYNNSHYQHELIGDWVVALDILSSQGKRQWLHQSEAEFAYDASRFQHTQEVILRVVLFAVPGDPIQIETNIRQSTQKRAGTQPLGTANSGCVFKNVALTPEQASQFDDQRTVSAGWLIDQAGLKGTRIGGAEVSTVHANFIVNTGNATSKDIEQLIALIQQKVKAKFGLNLEREVFFLGKEQS